MPPALSTADSPGKSRQPAAHFSPVGRQRPAVQFAPERRASVQPVVWNLILHAPPAGNTIHACESSHDKDVRIGRTACPVLQSLVRLYTGSHRGPPSMNASCSIAVFAAPHKKMTKHNQQKTKRQSQNEINQKLIRGEAIFFWCCTGPPVTCRQPIRKGRQCLLQYTSIRTRPARGRFASEARTDGSVSCTWTGSCAALRREPCRSSFIRDDGSEATNHQT